MNKRTGMWSFSILMALLLVSMATGASADSLSEYSDENRIFEEKALKVVSERNNIPIEQLEIRHSAVAQYPLTGEIIHSYKVRDTQSEEYYPVSIDEKQNVVDVDRVAETEQAEYADRYGKFSPDLYKKLQKADPDENISIWIWMTEPENMPEIEKDASDKKQEESRESRTQMYLSHEKPVIDLLRAEGIEITYASKLSPSIFADLPPDMILELSTRSDVVSIALSGSGKVELNSAAPSVKAPDVWNRGITGSGVQIAVIEDQGIAFTNPYLAEGSYYDPPESTSDLSDHATWVAGIIASTHQSYRGIANGCPALMSANAGDEFTDSDIITATEWAIANGADILSCSFMWPWSINDPPEELHTLHMNQMDRYYDHVVYYDHKTVVKSAGNLGSTGGNITSPGLAYNVITVGAYDDHDSATWSDDAVTYYSSFKDPISSHGDREKPEVVAPSGIDDEISMFSTSRSNPWISDAGAGTSFAAPVVSGEAALLIDRVDWLENYPESVKAAIMASAINNLEGESRLSDRDGAGGVDCSIADDIAGDNHVFHETLLYFDFPKVYEIYASRGQVIRAVLCWNSHPNDNHPPSSDPLRSDLDLTVYDPDSNLITDSVSFDNSYEIVEFTAPVSGTYTIQVDRSDLDDDFERIGFAYCYA
ncbi:hypothetical protein E2N92_03030 [Methanofollis formosanus]|uniref:Peptidase S8/S53 domain-containing protein n=1 Tax=Methanofollis formosanus TaxID=299308 RepID=A0A8G1A142_9EURY|nr:S8 family serine peptidase [Methanofollis formosanus]QYZ78474.1 hypothetical protein E2N92_03030 [Methanofollis formosanus]